jgi:hypothetical protein
MLPTVYIPESRSKQKTKNPPKKKCPSPNSSMPPGYLKKRENSDRKTIVVALVRWKAFQSRTSTRRLCLESQYLLFTSLP